MTNELGREMTSAERIAVALGQMTIMDVLHGVALELNAAYDAEVCMVMPSGFEITRGMLAEEIRSTRVKTSAIPAFGQRGPMIIGVNASSNMYA